MFYNWGDLLHLPNYFIFKAVYKKGPFMIFWEEEQIIRNEECNECNECM